MIYADYNGSAPVLPAVQELVLKIFQNGLFANPNAIHYLGAKTLMTMENARSSIAESLDADFNQIIFTSGATEGISTAFHSVLFNEKKKNKIIISSIEHSSVVNSANSYIKLGFEVLVLPVNRFGVVDYKVLSEWIYLYSDSIAIVSVMAANNETGVIQPYLQIAELCEKNNIPYLCDTTQFIGKTPFSFKNSKASFVVLSGHKIGAMPGTGVLVAKNPLEINPLIIGGGQEKGNRGGTQNYIGNETIALALKSSIQNFVNLPILDQKRQSFEQSMKTKFPNIVILGEGANRLATTTYLSYPGLHGQAVQIELEANDIFVTTSSACSDNMPVTSKVLRAMGVADDVGRGVIRISLGLNSDPKYYDEIEKTLTKIYTKLSQVKSY